MTPERRESSPIGMFILKAVCMGILRPDGPAVVQVVNDEVVVTAGGGKEQTFAQMRMVGRQVVMAVWQILGVERRPECRCGGKTDQAEHPQTGRS